MAPKKKVKPINNEKRVVSGQLAKKIAKQERKKANERGIVFLKNLPHGFFEPQMKGFFEQFGRVTRLRLVRSKRTGGSKGFAFIEFEYPEIAHVVAETMNNYFMFNKVVKAFYIPPEKQEFNYFKTSVRQTKSRTGKQVFSSSKTINTNNQAAHLNDWSGKNYQKRTMANIEKIKSLNAKYAHLGIDFSDCVVFPKNGQANGTDSDIKKKKPKSEAKSKDVKAHSLSDLLGNTINDDSDDEEYQPSEGSSDDESFESMHFESESDSGEDASDIQTNKVSKKDKEKSLKDEIPALSGRKLEEAVAKISQFSKKVENDKMKKNGKVDKKSLKIQAHSLSDLLGNTIDEDTDDEEYQPSEGSSEEESNGIMSLGDLDEDSIDENIEDDLKAYLENTKSKKTSDGFAKFLGRKMEGKIKKATKKPQVQKNVSKAKNQLKIEAAKELAKPLQQVRNKPQKTRGKKVK